MNNQFAGQNAAHNYAASAAMEDVDAMYPKCKFHPVHGPRLVYTAEQEAVMEEGWCDSPADFPTPEEAQTAERELTAAYVAVVETNRLLLLENADLKAQLDKKAKAPKAEK